MNLKNIIEKNYDINSIVDIKCINNGKINNTYEIITNNKKYIFQKINKEVFLNPINLMENIENVTNYLKNKNVNTISIIYTKDNKPLIEIEKEYYRMYEYIIGVTYRKCDNLDIIYLIGKAFGNFDKNLIDYKKNINQVITDFHNTIKIYDDFINNAKNNNKAVEIEKEINFIKNEKDYIYKTSKILKNLPLHLIHGDTKISNVIINNNICTVVDLDTIMCGTILYDYGDGIRSICDKDNLNIEKFKSYTLGYLSEIKKYLAKDEIDNMAGSIKIIVIELAIRYLNDYINGNIYFKIDYTLESLDKARNLIKLYSDIESKIDIINDYIKGVVYE